MRENYGNHSRFVGEWFAAAARGLSREQLLDLLQLALSAVWAAARVSISDVTLDAVLERVALNARDHFPWLPVLPVVHNSLDTSVWRAQGGGAAAGDTAKAARFIITEFVAVNANLTAETLSQGMRRRLAKVRWKAKPRSSKNGENSK